MHSTVLNHLLPQLIISGRFVLKSCQRQALLGCRIRSQWMKWLSAAGCQHSDSQSMGAFEAPELCYVQLLFLFFFSLFQFNIDYVGGEESLENS